MTQSYKWVETQGQKKIRQYLKDLFENSEFKKDVGKVKGIKNQKKRVDAFWKLVEDYSVTTSFQDYVVDALSDRKPNFEEDPYLDMCFVTDEADEYLNEVFEYDYNTPVSQRKDKSNEILAFPVHIGINPMATKRDVLDFINKRWEHIRDLLNEYDDEPIRIRTRPKEKRDELIWKHRDLPTKKILELLEKKYPEENLTYSDIHKILFNLKKRRYRL